MPSTTLKRKQPDTAAQRGVKGILKKSKRQRFDYHSSSDDDSDDEPAPVRKPIASKATNVRKAAKDEDEDMSEEEAQIEENDEFGSDASSDADSDVSEASTTTPRKKKKRNDPDAFATSMSKILGSKLTSTKRADPVLSRSKDATTASHAIFDAKLEAKAREKLRAEKKAALERGRIKDVLGLNSTNVSTQDIQQREKSLKRIAQKGVIKLFNAVRAAQIKGEEAERKAKAEGVVGIGRREEKVTEMSKQGFLDLIAGGGKKVEKPAAAEEEDEEDDEEDEDDVESDES